MKPTTKRFNAMGGEMDVVIYGLSNIDSEIVFKSIIDYEKNLEKIFNLFDAESELSTLNRNRTIGASPHLLKVLEKAIELSHETSGKYDVTLGRVISARKQGGDYSSDCSFLDLEISEGIVSLLHDDVLVDLGSIAKGYIVDMLIARMKSMGVQSGLIDARGDISVFGENVEVVDIYHPRDDTENQKSIVLDNCSVATSGDYRQYYGVFENSHILGGDFFSSVTVVGDNLFDSDALATSISVLDPVDIPRFLKNHTDVKVFAYGKDLSEHEYNNIKSIYPQVYVNAI